MSARGFSGKEEEGDLDAKIAEILAEGDSANLMDADTEKAYLQQLLDAARIEEDAEIAEMSPEQLFFSRHGIPALTEKVEQDKLDEELEKLAEELKNEQIEQIRNINASREADLAHRSKEMREEKNPSLKRSGIEKNRQAFARQAFDNRSNPRDDDEFGGGKKRTIRKKNRKGTRTTIRKRQRKNRTRTMRKKTRKFGER